MYYIYHIKGVKIGCTTNQRKRIIKRQGFTEYEILETHTDIYIASQREIELQKQYGLPVDTIPYYKTVKIAGKGGKAGGPITLANGVGLFGMSEDEKRKACSEGGKLIGDRNAKSGKVSEMGKISAKSPKHPNNVKVICEHCGKDISIATYGRWHGDKCKNKNTPI